MGFGSGYQEGFGGAVAQANAQQQLQMEQAKTAAALKLEDINTQKGAMQLANMKKWSGMDQTTSPTSVDALSASAIPSSSQAVPAQATGGADASAPTFGAVPQQKFGPPAPQFGASDQPYSFMPNPSTGDFELKENRAYVSPQQKIQNERELETTAQQRITSLRGDDALKNSETARESAKRGYSLIQAIKARGDMPNPAELNTILGHAYTAQTGKDATPEAIRGLMQQTFKEGIISQGIRKVTGQPMPAVSKPILDNLEQLVIQGGQQADKEHEDYMKSRTGIKPSGIDEQAWQNISGAGRGQSFGDSVGLKSFNSEAEAEASGYKGNAIIAGKRARID